MPDNGLLAPAWAGTGVSALVDDRALLTALLRTETALADAQAELGLLPGTSVAALRAVTPADLDPIALAAGVRATGNPVVAFVRQLSAAVAARDPQAAEHVHRGSTSQDILDTALMVLSSVALDRIHADLEACAHALAPQVEKHRGTTMAGRTLTQHAVPTTFGLKAAGWLHLVLDATERVRTTRTLLPVSIGGAAGTLSAYREFSTGSDQGAAALRLPGLVAQRLGLAEPLIPWHALRTPVADLAATMLLTTGALGKFAADVLVLNRTEIAEVTETLAPGTGVSSAMPHKQNPVLATLVATAARQLPPLALVLHQSLVVEDERSAGGWHAEWQPLRECLRLTAGAAANAAALARNLTIAPTRMRANLRRTHGAVTAERVTAILTPHLGKETARRLLAEASATADRDGRELSDFLRTILDSAGLDGYDPRELSDPAHYTGFAAELSDRVLDRYRSALGRQPPG
ncbi:adenylosuccinate lyase family protein [Nocardia sp. NPDC051832]|uniref:class-II fumarase/aspartase family protein n=1 Tax=Nocardia sp. NPDC051832 TaxID=3155673 RepID=UPI0034146F58